eukprot:TRINITY_DN14598_c0_g1_i4.p1 TRINITY_DN14598_c0_g1~~TRINITY_DN14598_c0_g1_i4.p1  ORF type:complete len:328 (-),score=53.65 TRINITY_DN14598_c0_g1_i4:4-987(-)
MFNCCKMTEVAVCGAGFGDTPRQLKKEDFGVTLPSSSELFASKEGTRQKILLETLEAFEKVSPTAAYHRLAQANLARWKEDKKMRDEQKDTPKAKGPDVRVLAGDWGDVSGRLVKEFGEMFAVLNMANAYGPGGGYADGMVAQEENMFRRTDCHFSLDGTTVNQGSGRYLPHETDLLNAVNGLVYLDTKHPRVCIRGSEDRSAADLGYRFLDEENIFPFYELRAAAVDLRYGGGFNPGEMRKRIKAQFDTCIDHGVRHVVLSAFGCGAFLNPASEVAKLYKAEIERCADKFDCIAFAIFHAGYGADNYAPFQQVFEETEAASGCDIA